MKPNPDPRTRLIADAVAGEWLEGAPGEFARCAAAHARARRRRARILAAGAVAVLAAVVALGVGARWRVHLVGRPLADADPKLSASASGRPTYEIISEADLLTALRDQPLLILPESPPDRRYVILNR